MSKSEREILVDEMARQEKARDDMQASYEATGNARSDNARYARQVIMNALEDAILKIDADMEKRIAQGAPRIAGCSYRKYAVDMRVAPWERPGEGNHEEL